jgi:hypothetical protein
MINKWMPIQKVILALLSWSADEIKGEKLLELEL